MNATQLENGSWYSFSNDSAIMNKKLLGQVYQNELAVALKKIGYEVEQRAHGQFDIKGYSPELLKTFSTRRGQIEALMEQWQASGKTVRDAEGNRIQSDLLLREVANLQSRKAKPQIIEAGQLLQSWRAVLAMQGLSLPELPGAMRAVEEEEAIATLRSASGDRTHRRRWFETRSHTVVNATPFLSRLQLRSLPLSTTSAS